MISDGVKAIQNTLFQEEHIVQTISPWSSNILVTNMPICHAIRFQDQGRNNSASVL